MPKKKLLIILGAGSSIAQGMPSVADLDHCMKQWSAEWPFSLEHNYFKEIWDILGLYYPYVKSGLSPSPNYEKVLGDMVALATWMAPSPHGNSLRQIIGSGMPLALHFPMFHPWAPSTSINDQLVELLIRLARHMRQLRAYPNRPDCRYVI